ncbi:MAG TPA: hypothetical protein VHT73_11440 [Thermodesulfobacteriota bacterium]|nr:hypothetical protein [Thermodesulfobacteriota bacterium]
MKNPIKCVAISGVALSLLVFPVVSKPLPISPSAAYASEDEDEENERDEVKGTIGAVDTAKATVTLKGKTYTLAPNAEIEKEGEGKITVSELGKYVGARAELKLNKDNLVYELEIEDDDDED